MQNKVRVLGLVIGLFSFVAASNWDTYPQVPKTATINGFADPIYSKLPKCAQDCVDVDTGNTPCPYWDTGCLCVMSQWSGLVAECFAEECSGSDVASATSLAYSLCSSVGADIWLMPASISTIISSAAGTFQENEAITTEISDTNIINAIGSTASASKTSSSTRSPTSSKTSKDAGDLGPNTLSSASFISIVLTLFFTLLV